MKVNVEIDCSPLEARQFIGLPDAQPMVGCITCHRGDSTARGPNLAGLYGHAVTLADGRTVAADDGYVRESILNPSAKVVAGFQPIMPNFQGQLSEEGVISLIAYIKSMGNQPSGNRRHGKSFQQSAAHVCRSDAHRLRFSGEIRAAGNPRVE